MKNMKRLRVVSVKSLQSVWQLETDEVKLDDLMKEDIGCDSIDCVEIVMELEKEFASIESGCSSRMDGSELCDYVEERLKERKK